jgi:hypothetical protein
MRPPDFIIGGPERPYLLRWWLLRTKYLRIYLHKIMRDDDDRALHDHPWWNISIVLRGGYREVTAAGAEWRGPGSIVVRRATAAPRLELPVRNGGIRYCWSLFITGPRIREWGFHCPNGWRVWHEFVDTRDRGQVGRGCE